VSFPSGVRDVRVIYSDLETRIGRKGDAWRGREVILRYPIAEAFVYARITQRGWQARESHFITVEAIPARRGLIQFYVASSSQVGDKVFVYDPEDSLLFDQRGEPVYCGVTDVR
jgi:hypothetical protein